MAENDSRHADREVILYKEGGGGACDVHMWCGTVMGMASMGGGVERGDS